MSGAGLRIERFKFAVLLVMPVATVILYHQPAVFEHSLKTNRYVVYPPKSTFNNPPLPAARRVAAARAAAPPPDAPA